MSISEFAFNDSTDFEKHVALQETPGSTTLDMVLADIPWSDELQLGWGVNALTGQGAALALLPFDLSPAEATDVKNLYQAIFDTENLSTSVSMAISGSYSIQGSTIGASSSFLDNVRVSSTQGTLLSQLTWFTYDYEVGRDFQLTPDAAALMHSDPDAFRNQFGDYFVQGFRRGGRMLVICTASARTSDKLQQFAAEIKGAMPNVFSVEGSTSLMDMASSMGTSLSVSANYVGLPKDIQWRLPQSVKDVPGLAEWFMEKSVKMGSPLEARLLHYSSINPGYKRTLDIPPKRFSDLQALLRLAGSVQVIARSLPKPYEANYKESAQDLQSLLLAHEAQLPRDPDLLDRLMGKAKRLNAEMADINARYRIFERGIEGARTEPKPGEKMDAGTEGAWFVYGVVPEDKAEAKANAVTEHYRPVERGGEPAKRRSYTWDERFDDQIIIGWKVQLWWGDSGRWWNPHHGPNIGGDHFHMKCESDLGLGFSYRVWIYTVPRSRYPFEVA
jgi:hypothetical protein